MGQPGTSQVSSRRQLARPRMCRKSPTSRWWRWQHRGGRCTTEVPGFASSPREVPGSSIRDIPGFLVPLYIYIHIYIYVYVYIYIYMYIYIYICIYLHIYIYYKPICSHVFQVYYLCLGILGLHGNTPGILGKLAITSNRWFLRQHPVDHGNDFKRRWNYVKFWHWENLLPFTIDKYMWIDSESSVLVNQSIVNDGNPFIESISIGKLHKYPAVNK